MSSFKEIFLSFFYHHTDTSLPRSSRPVTKDEKFIISIILVNTIVIFLQESGVESVALNVMDISCTIIFLIEMIVKHCVFGFKGYWSRGLNVMDGALVLISIPSLFAFFFPDLAPLSSLLVLRIFRTFRFFGLVRFFPYFNTIAANFKLALRQSKAVLLIFLIMIVSFALISCSMFKDVTPEFFGTPLTSIYSIFRMFTIEGWYEIPDGVAEALANPLYGHFVRLYFCGILIAGGIIGMSLINSIFVDAMVSDNNDDMKIQLERMEQKINVLMEALEQQKGASGAHVDPAGGVSEPAVDEGSETVTTV